MCGIVGVRARYRSVNESLIETMRDTFPYRGPDDEGLWVDSGRGLGFGHRRLSIIDPTPCGRQPMVDADSGCRIVFNGEIYNYIEIREVLEKKGATFTTHTDTEVILKAYREYGQDCLNHFNGMFAFAIWDPSTQEIFLARDRLGIKPLYYFFDNHGDFYFASEVKAILAGLKEPIGVNSELIDEYMSFGYVPGEDTLKVGIKRLLPGHCAVLSSKGLNIKRYWDVVYDHSEDLGFDYYLENSRALLESAAELRLRSDVPLGVFLSGGVDSSAVVALLAARVSDPIKTFSVAYDFGEAFDETRYARMVAKRFGTDHHELFVTPEQFRDFIPEYVRLMDEPVTEAAAISLYFLSRMTKDHVTVVLSGEGSDEVFGGYDFYRYMLAVEKYRKLLGPLARMIGSMADASPVKNKVTKYLTMLGQNLAHRYKGISTYEEHYKRSLYTDSYEAFLREKTNRPVTGFLHELFAKTSENDDLSRMLYFDVKTWLIDDLLIKADRMSMAASLELRVPFLDYRLVEFAAKMPSRYKVHNGQGKYVLKKMMEGLLPEEVIYRPKMGFPTPLKLMFQGELRGYADDLLLSANAKLHDIFRKDAIRRVLAEHSSKQKDHHRAIWQMVVLEQWLVENG